MKNNPLIDLAPPRNRVSNLIKHRFRLYLSKICFRVYQLAKERQEILSNINHLHRDIQNKSLHRSGYTDHYSEAAEISVLNRYKKEFSTNTAKNSEVVFRAEYVRDTVLNLAHEDSAIKSFINFGCSYGWLENQISSSQPRIRIWGIDRSEKAMRSNNEEFGKANCKFVAADIHDFIASNKNEIKDGIFCHINIGVYFLPSFIRKIYAALHDAGARYIVAFEPSGISRETNDYYRYTLAPQNSVVFRGPMLINNYPNLMAESGFELLRAEILHPPHPQPDFRSAFFVSRRVNAT